MTLELVDGNYEIDEFVFGTRDPRMNFNPYLVEKFDITPGTLITGIGGNLSDSGSGGTDTPDSSLPNEDGIKFGQDYYTGMILGFSVNVWHRYHQVYDNIGKFKSVWRNPKLRQTSNAVTALRMCRGGRTRVVYGRPREFKETYGEVERGWSPIDCNFQCVDEKFYDDEVKTQRIGIENPPVNGLTFPATAPFRLQQFRESYTTVHIGGDLPTWPLFEIYGPCVNPVIQFDNDWTLTLLVGLDHTQYITIDPRPWRRMTLKNGVVADNISGAYTQDSPVMREMQITPGQHTILFSAVDPSLTSYINVSWRSAYLTP